jgi:hypothetical protein
MQLYASWNAAFTQGEKKAHARANVSFSGMPLVLTATVLFRVSQVTSDLLLSTGKGAGRESSDIRQEGTKRLPCERAGTDRWVLVDSSVYN